MIELLVSANLVVLLVFFAIWYELRQDEILTGVRKRQAEWRRRKGIES